MLRLILCGLLLLTAASNAIGQTPADYLKTAKSHFDAGRYEVALAEVNKAIEGNPKLLGAYVLRFHITKQIDPESYAEVDCDRIIELAPNAQTTWLYYLSRSNFRMKQLNWIGAIEDLNKSLSLQPPDEGFIYNVRAFGHLMNQDVERARSDYIKSLEFKSSLPSPFVRRAYFRTWKMDLAGALSDYSKAIEWKSDYAEAYAYRGIIHGLQGNVAQAIEDIRRAESLNPKSISDQVSDSSFASPLPELSFFIKHHPTYARAYQVRGIFRLLQRKENEAQTDFSKCLELAPLLKSEIDWVYAQLRAR
jgi:tetratricopeptide (TPR) repeat protein